MADPRPSSPEARVALKAGASMKLLDTEVAAAVMMHPAHRANVALVTELIEWLRRCEEPADYYEFQRHLFGALHDIEERRAQCSRVIKRLKQGKPVPSDAPALPAEEADPADLATWEFEAFVYERLARQLRTVGDGLAWRCFGYDRRAILTLARNNSAGMLYGKTGLGFELGRLEYLWEDKGHFALLHDLTNCLRIADLTEFTTEGDILFHEVKRTPGVNKREKEQRRRIEQGLNAITHGGDLPGGRLDARLVELTTSYVTDLKKLNDLLQLAKQHGCRGMRLSQGRALVATSLPVASKRWKDNPEEGLRVVESIKRRAIKRAGIEGAPHHIVGYSGDSAARSPIMAPWSIYPFSPDDCADLICDLLGFQTIISVEALAESISQAGMSAQVLLQPPGGELRSDEDIIRAQLGNTAITLHGEGTSLLLYELVQPSAWASALRESISMPNPPAEPVMVFANETDTWSTACP